MQNKIKNAIEKELAKYIWDLNRSYSLAKTSPLLFRSIEDFVLRKGKRIRPLLFIIGYLGFTKRKAANLYKAALSIELLHDFMLVHDDIVDKSATRRGKPSMHKILGSYLKGFKGIKFNGQDLAIVAGDVMYAMAIDTFLSIKENMQRKEKALKKFIQAAIYTGMGEFIELLAGIKSLEKITKQEIFQIYDYKTANYTFACPLCTGAILAGATQVQIDRLYKYGIYLGRAFQIKDDIVGIFSQEKKIGKSPLIDLQEAKKTLLIWHAYNNADKEAKSIIKNIFAKDNVYKRDLLKMRTIVITSGALDYAKKEIASILKTAQDIINSCSMHLKYKTLLNDYSQTLLNL